MTIQEIHNRLRENLPFNRYDDFEAEELDGYINEAIDLFVSQRFNKFLEVSRQNLGFEEVQKRLDDLRTLLVTRHSISPIEINTTFNFASGQFPNNYRFLVSNITEVYYSSCKEIGYTLTPDFTLDEASLTNGANKISKNRLKSTEVLDDDLSISFSKTHFNSPIARVRDNFIEVYFENKKFIPKKIYINYIRKPQVVNLSLSRNCDLADHTHREIVKMATDIILEIIERRERSIDVRSLSKE
jgi:hypothetical protein